MTTPLHQRNQQKDAFLAAQGWGGAERRDIPRDASFRSYTRLIRADGARAILMDAPPPIEEVQPFAAIDAYLREQGFSAPEIFAHDVELGFLLLEDFGERSFTRLLHEDGGVEEKLYARAIDALVDLSRLAPPDALPALDGQQFVLPFYNQDMMAFEAGLLPGWFLPGIGAAGPTPEMQAGYQAAWAPPLTQIERQFALRPVLTLRDFHVDNLIWLDGRDGARAVGLLDFQGAVIGHPAYDLASLLQDARRDIDPGFEANMLDRFCRLRPVEDRAAFRDAYAILGAQRAAKIIGLFTRLLLRDGKDNYLRHLPRVWRLLERNLATPALAEVKAWFDRHIPVDMRRQAPRPKQ